MTGVVACCPLSTLYNEIDLTDMENEAGRHEAFFIFLEI